MPKLKNLINGNKRSIYSARISDNDCGKPQKMLRKLGSEIEASRREIEAVNAKLSIIHKELDNYSGEGKSEDSAFRSTDILDLFEGPAAVLDRSLRFIKANEGFCDTFRLMQKDWLGHYVYELIGKRFDRVKWEQLVFQAAFETKQKISFDIVHSFEDQKEETFAIRACLLWDSAKQEEKILLTASRVEKRINGHFSMIEEGAFRIMAENAPVMIWVSDTAKKRIYFNRAWLSFTGRTPEEENGHGWESSIHPEDLDRSIKIFNTAFDKREEYKKEYRLKRKDGEYRWILSQGVPFFNNGLFAGYIGSCVDINYRVEQELQKDEFLSIISHELKTPLTAMEVYTDLLRQLLIKEEKIELAEFTDKLFVQINKLVELVKEILDVSWINGKTLYFNNEILSINKLMEEMIEEKKTVIKSHRFITHLDPVDEILGDKARLIQVLDNIISNAVKYSPDANQIAVFTSQENNWITISIQDEGIGIPGPDIAKIFDRFFRSPLSAKTFPGLGLGLYVSKKIIKKHKGRIDVISEPDKGSTFKISFPSVMVSQHNT